MSLCSSQALGKTMTLHDESLQDDIQERDREIDEAHQALGDALALLAKTGLHGAGTCDHNIPGWAARPSVVTWNFLNVFIGQASPSADAEAQPRTDSISSGFSATS